MKKLTPETALKKAIKQILTNCGWFNHSILQSMGAYPGIPDILAIKDGRTVMIEAKSPKGKQSEHQVEYQRRYEQAGGTYLLIDNIDTLIEWLQEQGERISRR
jgi:Holliday junction resolvase